MIFEVGTYKVIVDHWDTHLVEQYELRVIGEDPPCVVGVIGTKMCRIARILSECPPKYVVCFKDNNPLNLSRLNLFVCTRSEARRAKVVPRADQLPSGKWRARVSINGKRITVGIFNTEDEALRSRYEKALEDDWHEKRLREVALRRAHLKKVDEERLKKFKQTKPF